MRKTAKNTKAKNTKTNNKKAAPARKKKVARKASKAAPATKAASSRTAGLNILFSPTLAGPLRKMARAQGIPAKKLAFNIVASAVAPMTATI